MPSPDLLRIIAEQAATVEEALDWLKVFHKDRTSAGGRIATYWLIADRRGNGLRVYQFHERLVTKPARDGFLVMRDDDPRGRLVREALQHAKGAVDARLFNHLSRQDPVLASSNISAYVIDKVYVDSHRPTLINTSCRGRYGILFEITAGYPSSYGTVLQTDVTCEISRALFDVYRQP